MGFRRVGYLLVELKPSYGALILVLVGIWLLFLKQKRAIIAILLGNLILGVIGFLQNPRWLQLFFQTAGTKVRSNLWVVSNHLECFKYRLQARWRLCRDTQWCADFSVDRFIHLSCQFERESLVRSFGGFGFSDSYCLAGYIQLGI